MGEESLSGFKPTHFAGGGVVGEFVRDEAGAVVGHRIVECPECAESAEVCIEHAVPSTPGDKPVDNLAHRHLPEVYGDAFYERGTRMRRCRCRTCGIDLEARRA